LPDWPNAETKAVAAPAGKFLFWPGDTKKRGKTNSTKGLRGDGDPEKGETKCMRRTSPGKKNASLSGEEKGKALLVGERDQRISQ